MVRVGCRDVIMGPKGCLKGKRKKVKRVRVELRDFSQAGRRWSPKEVVGWKQNVK